MSAMGIALHSSSTADLAPTTKFAAPYSTCKAALRCLALPVHHNFCRRLDCVLLTYIEALTARPAGMSSTTNVVQARACWLHPYCPAFWVWQ